MRSPNLSFLTFTTNPFLLHAELAQRKEARLKQLEQTSTAPVSIMNGIDGLPRNR